MATIAWCVGERQAIATDFIIRVHFFVVSLEEVSNLGNKLVYFLAFDKIAESRFDFATSDQTDNRR